MRRSVIVTILVATTMVLTAVSINAAPSPSIRASKFTPVAKVHDLMELNKELYKSLQANVQSDSPDWETAGHEARLVGEIANVLQYYQPTSELDWWRFAGAFGDGAKRLIAATEAKNAKKSIDVHTALLSLCKQCHNKYRQ